MSEFALKGWYGGAKVWWLTLPLLWPLSIVLQLLATWRRRRLSQAAKLLPVPVLVVGNISLGGTGKTPLLAALVTELQSSGWRPGIVSRGYGGNASYPLLVDADTTAAQAGDEPKMLAMKTAVPLVVDPQRLRAAEYLLAHTDCNLIISDDGLQHYRLARSIEIAVIDGQRGFGNQLCFPAGPLREPISRLRDVDFCVVNHSGVTHPSLQKIPQQHRAIAMKMQPLAWVNLVSGERRALQDLVDAKRWQAVCGIGNPARFFATLSQLGLQFDCHSFADHHKFSEQDFSFDSGSTLVMTEKDAVKCTDFARDTWWYLAVEAQLPAEFYQTLGTHLKRSSHAQ